MQSSVILLEIARQVAEEIDLPIISNDNFNNSGIPYAGIILLVYSSLSSRERIFLISIFWTILWSKYLSRISLITFSILWAFSLERDCNCVITTGKLSKGYIFIIS